VPVCQVRRLITLTHQIEFGGAWTQRKLDALKKYLQAYTSIFKKNPHRARFYSISYVDAFAGTGVLKIPKLGPLIADLPQLEESENEYKKGSVQRALEVDPAFDKYLFIEKNAKKCAELRALTSGFVNRDITVLKQDANSALLRWCQNFDTNRERAVVFLDPFGASVDWTTIAALGRTHGVDLWVLFPYSAINRMLVRERQPRKSWASRLTSVFGTADWQTAFYSKTAFRSLLDSTQRVERVHKSADHRTIAEFFINRLRTEFVAVSEPLPMYNSNGSLLFLLFFAAANRYSATTGLRIANDIIGK
jgi:three-Cys-motif partner protein